MYVVDWIDEESYRCEFIPSGTRQSRDPGISILEIEKGKVLTEFPLAETRHSCNPWNFFLKRKCLPSLRKPKLGKERPPSRLHRLLYSTAHLADSTEFLCPELGELKILMSCFCLLSRFWLELAKYEIHRVPYHCLF